jgi:hypothetical protein
MFLDLEKSSLARLHETILAGRNQSGLFRARHTVQNCSLSGVAAVEFKSFRCKSDSTLMWCFDQIDCLDTNPNEGLSCRTIVIAPMVGVA